MGSHLLLIHWLTQLERGILLVNESCIHRLIEPFIHTVYNYCNKKYTHAHNFYRRENSQRGTHALRFANPQLWRGLCYQAVTMNAHWIGGVLSALTMWLFVDVFLDVFEACHAQPWFNVHVIQEYLNLTGKKGDLFTHTHTPTSYHEAWFYLR